MLKMQNENILDDYLKKEIIQEEKNYQNALSTGKSATELKRIQDRIDYLKATYKQIKSRYQNSAQNDLSFSY
jgi:hypothetical protein